MRKLSLLIAAFALSFGMANAQNGLPANATPGKCYAKCYIPDQWKTETERVMVKEASTKQVAVPAKFETRTERVLVKEASKKLTVIPAKYETRTERILVKEASKKIQTIPARYETRTERVLVEEATTKWEKQKDAMCRSENTDDCIVWCMVEVPAQYKTVTKQVLVEAAKTVEVEIPAEYKTVTKQVMVEAAKTVEVEIPAEYSTITKQVQVSAATVSTVEVPAEYSTVTKRVLVKAGGMDEYREVVCNKNITNDLVRQVQMALMAKGYDVGPARADNIMGKDTKNALIKYQQDNGLPVGNLNKETLKHLGIAERYWN
ncbi:MAG: peptidoglycan-binding protein [Flavobacteriales bacterium]|nr:peptidoglycan-binding protein [Flavobacteriales bacterium]